LPPRGSAMFRLVIQAILAACSSVDLAPVPFKIIFC
jgi:hypothetical protein